MKCKITNQGGEIWVYCSGSITIDDRAADAELLDTLDDRDRVDVVLDISKVDAIDAGGLGALLTMREHVWSRGHSLSLANARGPIKTTLETASFDSLFEIR